MKKLNQIIKNLIKTTLCFAITIVFVLFLSTCIRNQDFQQRTSQIPSTPDAVIQIDPQDLPFISNQQEMLNYKVFFTPLVEFHGQAFPVKILSIAAKNTGYDNYSPRMHLTLDDTNYLGDIFGDFGVTLKLENNEIKDSLAIRIEIEGDRFINKSSFDTLIPPNREIEIFPRISYDFIALERLVQPTNVNVYFRLFIGSNMVIEKHEVVRFNSVNEVPIVELSRWDNESIIDHKHFFAAYVNEDHQIIDKILQEALQTGLANRIGFGSNFTFSGYQQKDSDGDSSYSVLMQVMAIWSVFLNHNIKYSDITTTSTANRKVISQYVRTLDESFENKQANCVDGTVLFASILRKINIEPFLVFVPGHMFLGFVENWEPLSYGLLETTMLGNVNISRHTRDDSWLGRLKNWSGIGTTQSDIMWSSFVAAYEAGVEQYLEALEYFDDEDNEDYRLLFISGCREFGIMPINRY
ncbi:MAG: hypothetical protein FWD24_02825 [Treponema sp.]|nr:hypothetical protein [Treponema sp.]